MVNFLHPMLLWGGLAVAGPVVIHLLNRRRFRETDWAAMDFLMEAFKRNRKRIRLENLVLLLLRCLAVLGVVVLAARPMVEPGGVVSAALPGEAVEHVVLLDDSASMAAVWENTSAFETARGMIRELVLRLGEGQSGDTLTLVLTSGPRQPVFHGQALTGGGVEVVLETVGALKASGLGAQPEDALAAVEELLNAGKGLGNRVLYCVSDFRAHDWAAEEKAGGKQGVAGTLERLGTRCVGVYLVDVSGEGVENLGVVGLTPAARSLARGVETGFEVVVANWGEKDAHDVEVRLKAGEGMELRDRVATVGAGQRVSVPFSSTFQQVGFAGVRAEIGADVLSNDNSRVYAAEVRKGIGVLLVDGESSSEPGRSGGYFLERALAPPGEAASGCDIRVVWDSEFESLELGKFEVVFLCNVSRLSEERAAALTEWVEQGGGLVFFLGDQVEAGLYNERLYRNGRGLLPVELAKAVGDEERREWVHLSVGRQNGSVLRVFEGEQNPFLKNVKFFRWWSSRASGDAGADGRATVLAGFTDGDGSPAVVEKMFGRGRVMAVTSSSNAGWNNWPADPSYVVVAQEVVRHLAAGAGEASLQVGSLLRGELEQNVYGAGVRLTRPSGEVEHLSAKVVEGGDRMVLEYPSDAGAQTRVLETSEAGFYAMELSRHDGVQEKRLFALNLDPGEGDLRKADVAGIVRAAGGERIHLVKGRPLFAEKGSAAATEAWRVIVPVLAALLCLEQAFAWALGRRG